MNLNWRECVTASWKAAAVWVLVISLSGDQPGYSEEQPQAAKKEEQPAVAKKTEFDSHKSTVSQDDIEVTLEWPETPLRVGDRIYAKLKIDNKRKEVLTYQFAPPQDRMFLECLQEGKAVPLTRYGDWLYHSENGDVKGGGVQPMSAREFEVDVSRIYDLSLEGEYTIRQQLTLKLRYDPEIPTRIKAIGPTSVGLKIELEGRF